MNNHEITKLPRPQMLRAEGKFLGYDQYDEVYLWKRVKWVVLSPEVNRNSGIVEHVHRFYKSTKNLVLGYSEDEDGSPIVKKQQKV